MDANIDVVHSSQLNKLCCCQVLRELVALLTFRDHSRHSSLGETSLVRFQVVNVDIYFLRYTRYPPHQVSVQFCAGECRPVSCDDGEVSFGRRRRETRRQFRDRDGVRYDRRLGQEVLDTDTANLGTESTS